MEPKYYHIQLSAAKHPLLFNQPYLRANVLVELPEKQLLPLEKLQEPERQRQEGFLAQKITWDALIKEHGSEKVQQITFIETKEERSPANIPESVKPIILDDGTKAWIHETTYSKGK